MSELRLASQIEPISGAVAQLGERELCKLEVVGSIPIGSTNLRGEAGKVCPPKPWRRRTVAAPAATVGKPQTNASVRDGISVFRTCVSTPKCPRMFVIFEIVKAGLAGLHNRLI